MKMGGKYSFFLKYVLTYMIVCIVTITIFGFCLYQNSVKATRNSTLREYQTLLSDSRFSIDNQLSQIYDIAIILQNEKSINNIRRLTRPIDSYMVPMFMTGIEELKSYCYVNNFISDIILYFANSQLFLSTDGAGIYPKTFFEVVLGYQNMDLEELESKLAEPQFMDFYPYKSIRDDNTYIDIFHDLPGGSGRSGVTMITRIEGNKLIPDMNAMLSNADAITMIIDSEGNIIYSPNDIIREFNDVPMDTITEADTVSWNNRTYHIFSEKVQNAKWQYIMMIPSNYIYKQEIRIIYTTLMLSLAVFLTGVFMSVAFAVYNMKPFKKLINSISMYGEFKRLSDRDEYNNLEYNIKNLIERNLHLKNEIDKQAELREDNFIDRLIKGSFSSPEEVDMVAEYSGINFNSSTYALAIFEQSGYNNEVNLKFLKEMEMTLIVIVDFLKKQVGENYLVKKIDYNRIVLIYYAEKPPSYSAIKDNMLVLIDTINKEFNIKLKCALSDFINDLSFISSTYYNLEKLLIESDNILDESIVTMENRGISSEAYYYPIDVENKLLNYIQVGNENEAIKILQFLFDKNQDSFKIGNPYALHFINAIKCTMIRAMDGINIGWENVLEIQRFDYIIYIEKVVDKDIRLKQFMEILALLCKVVNEKKVEKNNQLIKSIDRYIEENYYDKNLGLTMVARNFNLSDSYLSYFYKNQTGENLSKAIESARLEKALKLLKHDTLTIEDLAAAIGYTNSNTFYKAFKRSYGISPREYK